MKRGTKPIIGLMILILGMALRIPVSRASSNLSPTALSITTPDSSGAILPELDDFATAVLGDPWDMNEPSDLALLLCRFKFSR